jgi:hypothetical protein
MKATTEATLAYTAGVSPSPSLAMIVAGDCLGFTQTDAPLPLWLKHFSRRFHSDEWSWRNPSFALEHMPLGLLAVRPLLDMRKRSHGQPTVD